MTITINATTSNGLVVTPDNSGNVLLQYNGVSTPIFSAYPSATTNMSGTAWTKITYGGVMYDSAGYYSAANSRFTPLTAGYYQIFGSNSSNVSYTASNVAFSIWRNGNEYIRGSGFGVSSAQAYTTVSGIVYFNGSTDYIELWQYQNNGSTIANQTGTLAAPTSVFQGILIRGA